MAWNRIQAARLLTDKEMVLFEGSLSDQAPQMADKELGSTIRRVRTQRDKYQDLLQRQRLSSRARTGTKSGAGGVANARTDQKLQVFSEALERLEKQQALRERRVAKPGANQAGRKTTVRSAVRAALDNKSRQQAAGKPQASRSSKAPARSPKGNSGSTAATQSPAAVPNAMRMQAMGQQRPQSHVSSQGRRQQAKRDAE